MMLRILTVIFVIGLIACSKPHDDALSGYVESELLYMAPQDGGLIAELAVREGDRVAAGDLLFRLDPARAGYAAEQAKASAMGAAARAADNGLLDQQIAEAAAAFDNAQRNFNRSRQLLKDGVIAKARYDADAAAYKSAQARLDGARAQRAAAMRDWDAATAAADLAGRRLADLKTRAPAAGTIERIYRRPGEVVAAGDPVLALLPPENMKLRFFAPERMLSSFAVGQTIGFSCDGCADGMTAAVSFIASEPQFTPPIIYSLEEREKLVFLIEARIPSDAPVRSGMPVTIEPLR